ncbi:MAG: UvrD-helicase domain-containing protein [Spirochaetia bacterium]|jgi:ATP-dependent exoDNAse (exonuclease V) beta subunit
MPDLEQDTTLRLPRVTVLKASAGSGKTFRLTQRYVQFLLSDRIPKNELRNLMAITFSNNASTEMRRKVLEWLKLLCLKDPERLREMTEVTSGGAERLSRRAGELIENILSRFSEFQVRTIDSFMSSVFRASAIDFGFGPDFEVVLDAQPLVDYAWNLFLREAEAGSGNAKLLDQTIESILDFKASSGSYPWDPSTPLLAEIRKVEEKLSNMDETPIVEDPGPVMRRLEHRIADAFETLQGMVERSGLDLHGNSTFQGKLAQVQAGRFSDLLTGSMRNGPVKKPSRSDAAGTEMYARIESAWHEAGAAVDAYAGAWARAFYMPFLRLHGELSASLEKVKRGQGKIFIGDIGRRLGDYLKDDMVPDVYFRIGERIWHYLVDEFQDTSPLQWRTLFPLVENSLAMDGSLFVVGDTKQAIYGFRQADYTIMRALEAASPFASAPRDVHELSTNWRSRPRVVGLAEEVFRTRAASDPKYREAARRSGLDDWHQAAREAGGPGYVEVEILQRDDENPPEREKLQAVMKDLQARGYGWGDIALLAPKNADVVRATAWLNDISVPFISFSSLDVRTRTVAGEMLALLSFLDSPPDDLAFATFILGKIFARTLQAFKDGPDAEAVRNLLYTNRNQRPLYKAFQRAFPGVWKACFAGLFRSAGYLPLYDLVSEACVRFDVFSLVGDEEATLAKLLEAVKEFEGSGANSLREFLETAEEAGTDSAAKWAISVPRSAPSVNAMTIHKAKGLGFPVVVVLLYGESSHRFEYSVLRDGDKDRLVKITQDLARRDPVLRELYDQETMKADVDRLNRLYVALTRAEREMYVIGVKGQRDTYPFDLLPAQTFAPSREKGRPEAAAGSRERAADLSHEAKPVPVTFGGGRLGREERRRGELAHRMLELTLQAGPDLSAQLASAGERAAREARSDFTEARALVPSLVRLLGVPDIADCFTPKAGRTILTEQELCDSEGRLSRMDRIVVDAGRVTVIDFKTGAEDPAAHEAQVRDYMRILSEVYPARTVEALLAYVDLGTARRIS